MKTFVRQHAGSSHGVLSGFDRVRFRGTLRSVCFAEGLFKYLCFVKVLLVAFKVFFDGTSRKLRLATERLAKTTAVGKVVYLSGTCDKQQVVDGLLRTHGIGETFTGLIAVLSCVENCRSFELHKNADAGKLEVQSAFRKCLHYYLYLRHPRFGMMHVRIMTWFPMQVQICLNGREWLARQLDAAGIRCERRASVASVGTTVSRGWRTSRGPRSCSTSKARRSGRRRCRRRLRSTIRNSRRSGVSCNCGSITGRRNRRSSRRTWRFDRRRTCSHCAGVWRVTRRRISRART